MTVFCIRLRDYNFFNSVFHVFNLKFNHKFNHNHQTHPNIQNELKVIGNSSEKCYEDYGISGETACSLEFCCQSSDNILFLCFQHFSIL